MSCSLINGKINLDDILNKPEKNLASFLNKEGNSNFCYYRLDNSSFTHNLFEGKQVSIFCIDSKIIGYTIQIEGNDDIQEKIKTINSQFKSHKLNFQNGFGKEYQWNNSDKIIKLSYNDYKKLPKLTFYSELLNGFNLIV